MTAFGQLIAGTVDRAVRWVVIPVTSAIPVLIAHGVLLAVFAALWLAFGAALVVDPSALDRTWAAIGQLPLVLEAAAWLLFLPVMGGLWVWSTDWPTILRIGLVAGIAAWNLLVFLPHRPVRQEPAVAR